MSANLCISFELCSSFEKVISFEDCVGPVSTSYFSKGTLQTFLSGELFIINKQIHLVEARGSLDSLSCDSEPAVKQPVVCLLIESLQQ